jgi:hypothetical protein
MFGYFPIAREIIPTTLCGGTHRREMISPASV